MGDPAYLFRAFLGEDPYKKKDLFALPITTLNLNLVTDSPKINPPFITIRILRLQYNLSLSLSACSYLVPAACNHGSWGGLFKLSSEAHVSLNTQQ